MAQIEWIKQNGRYNYFKAFLTKGVEITIVAEPDRFSEDPWIPKEDDRAFYWKIEFFKEELPVTEAIVHYLSSLDQGAYPEFFDLEECKKEAEKFYFKYLRASLMNEIAEAKETIASREMALRILSQEEGE